MHSSEAHYRFGELLFCPNSGRLFRGEQEIRLAPLSRKLLSALVRHAPAALSAEDLKREVWDGRYVTQATIKQRVKLLRRAIDDDAQAPRFIALDRGIGYRLKPAVTAEEPDAERVNVSRHRGPTRPLTRMATLGLPLLGLLLVFFAAGARKIGPSAGPELPATEPARAEAVALVEQGNLFYQRRAEGDIGRAHDLYLRATAADPDYPEAWLALVGVYTQQYWSTGELDREEFLRLQKRSIERALALDPRLAQAHVRQAQYYGYSGEKDLAIYHLERALELEPDNILALSLRASDLFRSGERERSAGLMQRIVELEPYSAVSRHNLAVTLLALHRLSDAERELELVKTIHPSLADSMALEYGILRILQGRPDEVLELLPQLDETADRLALQAMALSDLGKAARSRAALSELEKIPGALARLREGEAEAYIFRTDTRQRTVAAIRATDSERSKGYRLVSGMIDDSDYSPFLALGDRYGRDADRESGDNET